jgi:hypothetical protein
MDSRELECLRYGVYDKPGREVAPVRLPVLQLDGENSVAMEAVIKKRLEGGSGGR